MKRSKDLTDPTGTKLTPSYHGKDCLDNGEHPGIKCCCDECGFFLECFPEYENQSYLNKVSKNKK